MYPKNIPLAAWGRVAAPLVTMIEARRATPAPVEVGAGVRLVVERVVGRAARQRASMDCAAAADRPVAFVAGRRRSWRMTPGSQAAVYMDRLQ